MPLQTPSHTSLPQIDPPPTASEATTITALITAELANVDTSTLHPLLPTTYTPHFTPLMTRAHDALASSTPMDPGIDLTRYEALSAPPSSTQTQTYHQLLQRAHTLHTYLASRAAHLSLLETYGKNAWLVSNAALEASLGALEREIRAVRAEREGVEMARREVQEGVRAEIAGLEEGWRRGVGRVVETEVAAEGVRREAVERRRRAAR
ncbi:hypothetical protein M501DRAFT_373653 [Patellaria atrata CBS 101060]|uniref:Uncharacterized protein n=1 Tax=Patellaria atrata CBS 101060 TaxID=1346257 RepID=A0A9P4SGJ4_9PEZI|nr:hypothetical protein M501DRAFT_373653 [Patellaria atrata CBS 101060]